MVLWQPARPTQDAVFHMVQFHQALSKPDEFIKFRFTNEIMIVEVEKLHIICVFLFYIVNCYDKVMKAIGCCCYSRSDILPVPHILVMSVSLCASALSNEQWIINNTSN